MFKFAVVPQAVHCLIAARTAAFNTGRKTLLVAFRLIFEEVHGFFLRLSLIQNSAVMFRCA